MLMTTVNTGISLCRWPSPSPAYFFKCHIRRYIILGHQHSLQHFDLFRKNRLISGKHIWMEEVVLIRVAQQAKKSLHTSPFPSVKEGNVIKGRGRDKRPGGYYGSVS